MGGDQDYRRPRSTRGNDVEPIVQAPLLPAESGVPQQQEKGPVGEKKLMSGVVDFLSAEIPGAEPHGYMCGMRVLQKQVLDREAMRRWLVRVVWVAGERLDY